MEFLFVSVIDHQYSPSANEVEEGNVFTPVCQSFCSQGVAAKCMLESTPHGQTPPWADTLQADILPNPPVAIPADGTHPTGMHYCSEFKSLLRIFNICVENCNDV